MNSLDHRNVVLTGFMGTGKTTVGRLLAERIRFEFVDTDQMIEQRHGPIPQIFLELGEAGFRELERGVADELADRTGLVISTGGRMLVDPHNAAALGRTGRVFCLVASPERILERVAAVDSISERPLLSGPDPRSRIAELLAEREPAYSRFPQLSTDDVSPDAVAADIEAMLAAPENG